MANATNDKEPTTRTRYTFGAIPTSDHMEDSMDTRTDNLVVTQARLDAALVGCHAACARAVRRAQIRQARIAAGLARRERAGR